MAAIDEGAWRHMVNVVFRPTTDFFGVQGLNFSSAYGRLSRRLHFEGLHQGLACSDKAACSDIYMLFTACSRCVPGEVTPHVQAQTGTGHKSQSLCSWCNECP